MRSPALLLIPFVLAAVLAPGCGVKSQPIPPSETIPVRISDLSATNSAHGVQLLWGRPTRYQGGGQISDLAGFALLRAEGTQHLTQVAELPITDQERLQKVRQFTYIDGDTQLGHRYRYAIVSEVTDGTQSPPSNIISIKRRIPPPPPNPNNFVLPQMTPLPAMPTPAPTP
ncbi:MAG TPA: hypothetical protein VMV13_11720 [Candidatus Binataceae bacterium]|nr:hypothetical protein [Candidatus Binataceae bacterium]